MTTKKYIYWQDEEMWLGYLEEYPDYWTQAETENELKENLTDIYKEVTSGIIPNQNVWQRGLTQRTTAL